MRYELPDGQMIKLKEECIKCPEVFFDPKLIDLEGVDGLPDAIMDTVKKIPPAVNEKPFKQLRREQEALYYVRSTN